MARSDKSFKAPHYSALSSALSLSLFLARSMTQAGLIIERDGNQCRRHAYTHTVSVVCLCRDMHIAIHVCVCVLCIYAHITYHDITRGTTNYTKDHTRG